MILTFHIMTCHPTGQLAYSGLKTSLCFLLVGCIKVIFSYSTRLCHLEMVDTPNPTSWVRYPCMPLICGSAHLSTIATNCYPTWISGRNFFHRKICQTACLSPHPLDKCDVFLCFHIFFKVRLWPWPQGHMPGVGMVPSKKRLTHIHNHARLLKCIKGSG